MSLKATQDLDATIDSFLYYGVWTGLILLLFVPLIVSTQTIFPYIVGKAIYARVVIEIVFGLWIVLAYRNKSYQPPRSWILGILVIHLCLSFLAGIFGVSFQRSLWSTFERMQGVVDLAHWVAITVVLASVLRTRINWQYLLNFNLIICLVVALLGWAQDIEVGNRPFLEAVNIPFYSSFLQVRSLERLGSTLGNSAFLGTYLMVNILIALGFLIDSFLKEPSEASVSQASRRRRNRAAREGTPFDFGKFILRLFWVATIGVGLWVLTLTGTRGALVGLVIGLTVGGGAYLFLGREKYLKIGVSAAIGAILVAIVLLFALRSTSAVQALTGSNILLNRLVSVSVEDAPIKSRLLTLSVAANGLASRPIFGFGPENYLIAYGRYFDADLGTVETLDQAHNKPVEELVTKGIAGLLSYGAIWILVGWVMFRNVKSEGNRNLVLKLSVAAALAAYFVQNLFLFDTPATVLQFILLLGFVVALEADLKASDAGVKRTAPAGRILESIGFRLRTELGPNSPPGRAFGFVRKGFARSKGAQLAGLVAVVVLVPASMYFTNFRMYDAASTILRINGRINTFDQAMRNIEDSIDAFEPLANYPRLILFRNAPDVWGSISETQADQMLAMVEREAGNALAVEPDNWRIYLVLATTYMRVVEQSPQKEYLDSAYAYLEEARRLAPDRVKISDVEERLDVIKRRIDGTP